MMLSCGSGWAKWAKAHVNWLVVALLAVQFTHWFKPSESYLVAYVEQHGGIPNAVTYDTVYPWYTYTLLPCTLLAGMMYEVFGQSTALLMAAIADIFSVALVIPATQQNLGPFVASEVAYGLSFTSLFLVTATLTAHLRPMDYQKACSYNRVATLLATMSSASLGQVLVDQGWLASTIPVSLAFSVLSAGILAAFVLVRGFRADTPLPQNSPAVASNLTHGGSSETDALQPYLHLAAENDAEGVGKSHAVSAQLCCSRITVGVSHSLACVYTCLGDETAALLAIALATVLATHTLAVTYWQSLFDIIAPGELQNGSILAAAYAASAVAAWIPSIPLLDARISTHATASVVVSTAAASALLFGMARADSLAVGASCFVLYHAVAEACLVTLNAALGRRVAVCMSLPPKRVEFHLQQSTQEAPSDATSGAEALQTRDESLLEPDMHLCEGRVDTTRSQQQLPTLQLAVAPDLTLRDGDGIVSTVEVPLSVPSPQPHLQTRFGAVFSAVTLASQTLQIALQYTLGTTGLNLSLATRYKVYAGCICALGGALLLLRTVEYARRRADTCKRPDNAFRQPATGTVASVTVTSPLLLALAPLTP